MNEMITKAIMHLPVYVVVHAVMLSKQYRSCTVKDMGLTIEV